jgi:hypothetical protein
MEIFEDAGGQSLLLAHEAEQEVLGADIAVAELPCFLLGEDDDVARPLGKALEHRACSLPRNAPKEKGRLERRPIREVPALCGLTSGRNHCFGSPGGDP